MGFGKNKYPELFYLKTIVKPGDYCIDIGANMGYYSVLLSKYAGASGKVFAVEPVPLFAEIWKKNTNRCRYKNLTLFNCALGKNETNAEMGMPFINGVAHHGMTKVVTDESAAFEEKFQVEMKNPDSLFSQIEKIDFIKVDVEGYESIVFDNMIGVLTKHKPLIQSELSGAENRKSVIKTLSALNYKVCILQNNEIIDADQNTIDSYTGDFYFKTK